MSTYTKMSRGNFVRGGGVLSVSLLSIEPNEMQFIMLHFILAFTVCISTRLGVKVIKDIKELYQYKLK